MADTPGISAVLWPLLQAEPPQYHDGSTRSIHKEQALCSELCYETYIIDTIRARHQVSKRACITLCSLLHCSVTATN
jgi:hypothetical protein